MPGIDGISPEITKPNVLSGTVANTPASASASVYVNLPALGAQNFGPVFWRPQGTILPQKGATALVVFDDQERPWMIWGGGAMMASATAGLRAARPAAVSVAAGSTYYATDNGITYQSDGISVWAAIQWASLLVAALPTSPTPEDRQLIEYVADAANGVVWRFRYRAASSSAYKWEFVGGPPLMTNDGGTEGSTTNLALTEPDTACRITLPAAFSGDFLITGTGRYRTATANTLMQSALAVAATTHLIGEFRADAAADFRGGFAGRFDFTGVAAGSLVTIKIDNGSNDGNTVFVNYRTLTVTPVRVG